MAEISPTMWLELQVLIKEGNLEIIKTIINRNTRLLNLADAQGHTALHIAARFGRTHILQYLLSEGSHVDAKSRIGQTPLVFSIEGNNEDCVEVLLREGANLDARTILGTMALELAFQHGRSPPIVKIILQAVWNNSSIAQVAVRRLMAANCRLFHAVHLKTLTIDSFLLAGEDINARDPEDGLSAIQIAALLNDVPTVELLLKRNADINSLDNGGRNVLCNLYQQQITQQATRERYTVTKILLARGLDIKTLTLAGQFQFNNLLANGTDDELHLMLSALDDHSRTDDLGNSITHYLARNFSSKAVDILYAWIWKNKLNLNSRNAEGETPLMWAARYANLPVIKFLLSKGADVNAQCNLGLTALTGVFEMRRESIIDNHLKCIEFLLHNGADPQILRRYAVKLNNLRITIFTAARGNNHFDLICPVIAHLVLCDIRMPGAITQDSQDNITYAPAGVDNINLVTRYIAAHLDAASLEAMDKLDREGWQGRI